VKHVNSCNFNSKVLDRLSEIFLAVYSDGHLKAAAGCSRITRKAR
jgi:hypothetical protein